MTPATKRLFRVGFDIWLQESTCPLQSSMSMFIHIWASCPPATCVQTTRPQQPCCLLPQCWLKTRARVREAVDWPWCGAPAPAPVQSCGRVTATELEASRWYHQTLTRQTGQGACGRFWKRQLPKMRACVSVAQLAHKHFESFFFNHIGM